MRMKEFRGCNGLNFFNINSYYVCEGFLVFIIMYCEFWYDLMGEPCSFNCMLIFDPVNCIMLIMLVSNQRIILLSKHKALYTIQLVLHILLSNILLQQIFSNSLMQLQKLQKDKSC